MKSDSYLPILFFLISKTIPHSVYIGYLTVEQAQLFSGLLMLSLFSLAALPLNEKLLLAHFSAVGAVKVSLPMKTIDSSLVATLAVLK